MPSSAALWCLTILSGQVLSSPLTTRVVQRPYEVPTPIEPVIYDEGSSSNHSVILDLLAQYAPIFKLSELESFFPSSIDYMFPHYNFTESPSGDIQTLNKSLLSRSQLNRISPNTFLSIRESHNPQPFLEEEAEYLFGPFDRTELSQDGRGKVEEEVYGFGVDQGDGIVDLWYWTFYPFNFGKPVGLFGILGNHVADWEHLRMRTVNGTPVSADYTTHTGGRFSAGTFRWEDIEKIDNRPVAYVAAGSHGIGKLFKLVDITDDEGPIWDTKDHVVPTVYWDGPESRRRLWHRGNSSWLNFRGNWGNKGQDDCWWHRVVGYCQVVDAPWGPNRYFGTPPDCILAPLVSGRSTYSFKFSSNILGWAKEHNIALVKVEQVCTRPKENDDDDDDEPDDVYVFDDEAEGEIEIWNVKSLTEFKGIERHIVDLSPCKGRQSAVRAYRLSLCLINGKCLSSSRERRICTYEEGKKGNRFGGAVDLLDVDDWRWDY
ncbi:uncharacterized protein I206_105601 [Kwoniella pini CBS 10737]|uniref:Vacuolar protein sorting-associated protein 62 n=1 Tax=Kwoniella pini CBS 10737 TaxID=1296096 RepID=A0A1B9I3T5_9TREE|nr:uncharacterized protein I206_03499 [Kwoniella pini CBS 10737]OCF50180.1 hypothetical protein I206_03499 [Kwoniella pini CBS 10737]